MERSTRQRTAIRTVIDTARRPLSPQEVLLGAQELVAEGAVQMVSLPGESPRYESSGHAHHHHFQCETCGRVFDVHQCPGDLKHLAPAGFLVRHHELTLYGQCADCHTPV